LMGTSQGIPEERAAPLLPKTLYLEVTNRCNLRCRGCIRHRGGWEAERDLSLDEAIGIADQLPEMERAVLHGIGEPLLNRDLPAMIRHLKGGPVTVLFNSNGLLLDEKRQYELIDSGLDELRISLDAASPQGYKALRNSHQFDRVVENLRLMVSRLKSQSLNRPKLSLWFLGSRENIDELPQFVLLAADIGISEVYLQRLVYFLDHEGYGLAHPECSLFNQDGKSKDLMHHSYEIAQQLGIRLCASGLTNPLQSMQKRDNGPAPWKDCLRPWEVTYITAQGNVLPCCIAPFSTSDYAGIILGNVFENSLEKVWFGPRYQSFRKRHQTSAPFPCCKGCGINWSL
jgi:MoaA/NifB/PqqE/SkfB family radical SAM enzyme